VRVSLFVTCLADLFEPQVAVAAVRLLRAAGCDVSCPERQTCCGQPAWNSGFAHEAARVARTSLGALIDDGADAVVVPAGSCATMIRVFWPELFDKVGDHDAAKAARQLGERTFELCELLAQHRPVMAAPPEAARPVAYHHSCHMLRELHIEDEPLSLLSAAGCSVVSWSADRECCGFGGTFAVKLPEASEAMADHKLASLASSRPSPEVLVGSDGSCLMHLRSRARHQGRTLEVRHIAEVLAEALE
jgi:L-lactate dehydrogenase complex protein LldE